MREIQLNSIANEAPVSGAKQQGRQQLEAAGPKANGHGPHTSAHVSLAGATWTTTYEDHKLISTPNDPQVLSSNDVDKKSTILGFFCITFYHNICC